MLKLATLLCFLWLKIAVATPTEYFCATYEACDKNFDQLFNEVKAKNPKAEVYQFLYDKGAIKNYFIPARYEQKNLMIIISGTHGIEGFAGSAIQQEWLAQNNEYKNTAFLYIHGFNHWGFKNFRRVNENNVDLNRSFIIDRNHFKPDDSKYSTLNNFLNPSSFSGAGLIGRTLFYGKAIYYIMRSSIESLRTSILKGQYSFPKGIFYGGKEPQPQELLIDQLISRYLAPYKNVFIIDLHTGYGERAKLHLLAGKSTDANSIELKTIFSESEIDFADKKNFYGVEGEMTTYFAHKIVEATKAHATGVVFEIGTMDSQKTLGSIESLRRIILENQSFHNPSSVADAKAISHLFLEMFYPSDPIWRESALKQADEKLNRILVYLNQR